jgi:hypothetical protein
MMAVARVEWTDQTGKKWDLPARIEDTSRSGACIRMSVPISVDSKLIVDWRDGRFSGVVKYCRADGDAYSMGIRRDAPVIAAQPKVSTKVSTEVETIAIEPAASDNVLVPPADPKPIVESLTPRAAPKETIMSSVVIHREGTQAARVGYKTEFTSDPDAWRVTERNMEPPAERHPERPSHREERLNMLSKWLKPAPKQEHKNVPNGSLNGARASNSAAHTPSELPYDLHARPGRKGPAAPQGNLLPLEDVYRATGILDARAGYNVLKVVEMLGSSHIRELPDEMRRASVLMALDAAGISVEEILEDARLRLEALASYESDQEKRLKESESRKLQENAEIQLEMEQINEHYLERMNRNLDEVALERSPFVDWQKMKQQEVQRIADAVGLCEKQNISKPPSVPPSQSALATVAVAAEPADLASKHGAPAAGKGPGRGDNRTLDA